MSACSQWRRALPGLLWLWGVCVLSSHVGAQTLTGVSVSPSSVIGGLQTNLSVTLSAPAPPGGLSVSLGCQPAGAVGLDANTPFPTTVTVPAGQSGCSYAALTSTANAPTPITITATLGTQSQTTTLTLLPAHLRVTKVLPASTLRLQWDQTNYSFFQLLRDGSLIATLSGSTLTYDDAIVGGFAPNHTYVYTLLGQSNGSYAQIDMEMVIPGSVTTAGSNQAVDSRLDLRYSDNHLLDHVFGGTTYRGGLFVGYSSDPSKVGRSFARFGPFTGGQPTNSCWREGNISAYFTGMAGQSAGSVNVGCQAIADAGWDYSKLVWSLTDPTITPSAPSFTPGAATNGVAISYDPANPVVGWQTWDLSSALHSAVIGSLPLSVVWAAVDETSAGWAYFAKTEYNASLGPRAMWAWTVPYPISVCIDTVGGRYGAPTEAGPAAAPSAAFVTLNMHGLGVGDSVGVTLSGPAGAQTQQVTVTGLQRRFQLPSSYVRYTEAGWTITVTATCNGVSATSTIDNYSTPVDCSGSGGNLGPPVGGGGLSPGG